MIADVVGGNGNGKGAVKRERAAVVFPQRWGLRMRFGILRGKKKLFAFWGGGATRDCEE